MPDVRLCGCHRCGAAAHSYHFVALELFCPTIAWLNRIALVCNPGLGGGFLTKKRIAIVSDLHIGDSAREFDLRPGGSPAYAGQKGYLDSFEEDVQRFDVAADYLVVSGDITDRAQPSQFSHAGKVITRIARALKVPDDAIISVPGNHDLNWDVAKLATDGGEAFWLGYRFAPFASGHDVFGKWCSIGDRSLIEEPHFTLRSFGDCDFWSFNSAAYDTPDKKPHRGEIREKHREELHAALKAAYSGQARNKYRVFVTHHHLRPQRDPHPDQPDFSTMINGDALLDMLIEHQFDLVMHGHKHRPWCRSFVEAARDPIVVWCSGSFSQTLGASYYGSIGNLWHLVELHGRREGSDDCFGQARSWAYAPGRGWVPSRPNEHGIDHVTPFGYVADRHTIQSLVTDALTSILASRQFVTWAELCDSHEALRYQAGTVVWPILEAVCPQLGARPHGDRDSLDGLIILSTTVTP